MKVQFDLTPEEFQEMFGTKEDIGLEDGVSMALNSLVGMQYFSETKNVFLDIDEMNPIHCLNAIRKLLVAQSSGDLFVDETFMALVMRVLECYTLDD
jgi:hypothetical protein